VPFLGYQGSGERATSPSGGHKDSRHKAHPKKHHHNKKLPDFSKGTLAHQGTMKPEMVNPLNLSTFISGANSTTAAPKHFGMDPRDFEEVKAESQGSVSSGVKPVLGGSDAPRDQNLNKL